MGLPEYHMWKFIEIGTCDSEMQCVICRYSYYLFKNFPIKKEVNFWCTFLKLGRLGYRGKILNQDF